MGRERKVRRRLYFIVILICNFSFTTTQIKIFVVVSVVKTISRIYFNNRLLKHKSNF